MPRTSSPPPLISKDLGKDSIEQQDSQLLPPRLLTRIQDHHQHSLSSSSSPLPRDPPMGERGGVSHSLIAPGPLRYTGSPAAGSDVGGTHVSASASASATGSGSGSERRTKAVARRPRARRHGQPAAATAAAQDKYPRCPAFEEIAARLGPPDLNMLPISVGATLGFLKGLDPFPSGWSPFPCGLHESLTAANHMTPRDAVRCFRLMHLAGQVGVARAQAQARAQALAAARRDGGGGKGDDVGGGDVGAEDSPPPVAMAIHWGTFVGDPDEPRRSLRRLRLACRDWHVTFARGYDEAPAGPSHTQPPSSSPSPSLSPSPSPAPAPYPPSPCPPSPAGQDQDPTFVAVNAGEAVTMRLRRLC